MSNIIPKNWMGWTVAVDEHGDITLTTEIDGNSIRRDIGKVWDEVKASQVIEKVNNKVLIPKSFEGWGVVITKKGYIALQRKINGKAVQIHLGRDWDEDKAADYIRDFENKQSSIPSKPGMESSIPVSIPSKPGMEPGMELSEPTPDQNSNGMSFSSVAQNSCFSGEMQKINTICSERPVGETPINRATEVPIPHKTTRPGIGSTKRASFVPLEKKDIPITSANVREALSAIDPNLPREEWWKIGAAIKDGLGEEGFGLFNDWSRGGESYDSNAVKVTWKSTHSSGRITIGTLWYFAIQNGWKPERELSQESIVIREERARIRKEAQVQEEKKVADEHAQAASKAKYLWDYSSAVKDNHPYLVRKGLSELAVTYSSWNLHEISAGQAARDLGYPPRSNNEYLEGRLLLVPVKIDGKLSTCELIDGAGRKSAIKGGAKSGGYWTNCPEGYDKEVILIAEGVATALSVYNSMTYCVFAALSCGNLKKVAEYVRAQYPETKIIILADLGNGQSKATEAALAVDGYVATPDFGPNRLESDTDFNDLYQKKNGDSLVMAQIKAAVKPEPRLESTSEPIPAPEENLSPVGALFTADRPAFHVIEEWIELEGNRKLRPGVWYFSGGGEDEEVETWICSPIHIDAVTFDGQDNNFGRMLRLLNTNKHWRQWAMPMEFLSGLGNELRSELLAMGVEISPNSKARNLLATYLQENPPLRKVRCALQTGWCKDSFVLPDTVIGPSKELITFQSGERGHEEQTCSGTLEGWKENISKLAIHNTILMLSLSTSFTGPLLYKCNGESGGLHFVGDSSTGKTTAIEAACSVWGGRNYKRSWRATANGMEGAAALFNDCLLALDEINECDPKEVGAIIYALGNGVGKQRARRTGTARPVTRWRTFVLSSGERSLPTVMLDAGKKTKAGQSMRLIDVPIKRDYGAWDDLHGHATGAEFSDAIKAAAFEHHGIAGRTFLEHLADDKRDFVKMLTEYKQGDFLVPGADGQVTRVGSRFATIALAGELATEYGITGWDKRMALMSALDTFHLWTINRGLENDESHQVVEQLSDFLDRHGDSRFSGIPENGEIVRDRAGWYRNNETSGSREYLFTSEGLREALKGFDFERALDLLEGKGKLICAGLGKNKTKLLKLGGRVIRLYVVNP